MTLRCDSLAHFRSRAEKYLNTKSPELKREISQSADLYVASYQQTGDEVIAAAICRAYEPLVSWLVVEGRLRQDEMQVGYVGLVNAMKRFDLARGVPFASFARRQIRGEILHFKRDYHPIQISRNTREKERIVRRIAARLEMKTGRRPHVSQVAAEAGIEEALAEELLALRSAQLVHNDPDGLVLELISSGSSVAELVENKVLIEGQLAKLPARNAMLLRMYFLEELSQEEIAQKLDLSQMHVSRLLRRTIAACVDGNFAELEALNRRALARRRRRKQPQEIPGLREMTELFVENGGQISYQKHGPNTEIATLLGKSYKLAHQRLRRMFQEGFLEDRKEGRVLSLTEAGTKFAVSLGLQTE